MNKKVLVNLNMSFPEGDVQKMLCHLNQLDEIRWESLFGSFLKHILKYEAVLWKSA